MALAPRPFPLRTHDGLAVAADAYGDPDSAPVLLLHGGGQTRHAWRATARRLAAGGYRAVAVDLRGHGDTDWAPDGNYALDAFARDVLAFAEPLASPPALVGASLGGLAALLTEGEIAPGTASAVVLVDVGPRLEPAGVDRILAFMTARPEGFASLEEAADAIATYLPNRPRPTDLGGLAKNLRLRPDGRYRWHWDPAFISGDRRPGSVLLADRLFTAARRLAVPTLVVRGRESDTLSEEGARELVELLPHGHLVDVAGARHMVAGDRNDVFANAVITFLDAELGAGDDSIREEATS